MTIEQTIDDISRTAATLQTKARQIEREREANEGKAARAHFKDLRQKLTAALFELRSLTPQAEQIIAAAEKVLDSGALPRRERNALIHIVRELEPVHKSAHAIEAAVARIDDLRTDDPQRWPKKDFANGALANPGYTRKLIASAIEIMKPLTAAARVNPPLAVPPHPIAAAEAPLYDPRSDDEDEQSSRRRRPRGKPKIETNL